MRQRYDSGDSVTMEPFIGASSIVKKIWSTTDVTLFIFAGASAEFALNKQVDWLYFTGKLPADPIGRLFSTVQYAQQIIFNEETGALSSIDRINAIHKSVESARARQIPEAAYKDVLYMLIYYSIVAFELIERKLTVGEKDEVVHTFAKIGERMNISNIPVSYYEWQKHYIVHLQENLINSFHTKDLFKQYRKHLGSFRYFVLLEIQRLLVSPMVNDLLDLGAPWIANHFVFPYKLTRPLRLNKFLINLMVPKKFRAQVRSMDKVNLQQYGTRI
jgi:uncharacterized protein (DUF2236 family)